MAAEYVQNALGGEPVVDNSSVQRRDHRAFSWDQLIHEAPQECCFMKTVMGIASQVDVDAHLDVSSEDTSWWREIVAVPEAQSADEASCRDHGPHMRCGNKEERAL